MRIFSTFVQVAAFSQNNNRVRCHSSSFHQRQSFLPAFISSSSSSSSTSLYSTAETVAAAEAAVGDTTSSSSTLPSVSIASTPSTTTTTTDEPEGDDEISSSISPFPSPPPHLISQAGYSVSEWKQRCELAVSYRIAHMENWDQNIFNHITLKVQNSENEVDGPHFFLNNFGDGFDEVTASSLLKVNLDGHIIEHPPLTTGSNKKKKGKVFMPGYVIHSAVHSKRHDVMAVWHCHDLDTTAVCQTKHGLLPISQEAFYTLARGVGYHPFEGTATDVNEVPRIVSNMAQNAVLMLESHGPLATGSDVAKAFASMYFVTRACKYQIRALASVGGNLNMLHMPSQSDVEKMMGRVNALDEGPNKGERHDTEKLMFEAARRKAERKFGSENIYR